MKKFLFFLFNITSSVAWWSWISENVRNGESRKDERFKGDMVVTKGMQSPLMGSLLKIRDWTPFLISDFSSATSSSNSFYLSIITEFLLWHWLRFEYLHKVGRILEEQGERLVEEDWGRLLHRRERTCISYSTEERAKSGFSLIVVLLSVLFDFPLTLLMKDYRDYWVIIWERRLDCFAEKENEVLSTMDSLTPPLFKYYKFLIRIKITEVKNSRASAFTCSQLIEVCKDKDVFSSCSSLLYHLFQHSDDHNVFDPRGNCIIPYYPLVLRAVLSRRIFADCGRTAKNARSSFHRLFI